MELIRSIAPRLSRRSSAIVAVLILLLFGGGAILSLGTLSSGRPELWSSAEEGGSTIDFRAAEVGASRDEIERRLGEGQDALDFMETGVAVEPMDADCRYYPYPRPGYLFQVCYRDDRLVTKRAFAATPGAALAG